MAKKVKEDELTNSVNQKIDQYNSDAAQVKVQNMADAERLLNSQPTYTNVDVPDANRATTYEDLYKQYYDTPMSKEEEDRRKRAATAVNGIAGLGNVANAFANLIYTGKGAPNMTLPTYKGADLQAFSDKAAQARRLYADAQIKGRQLDDNAYNQALQQRNNAITINNNVEGQRYNSLATALGQMGNARNANLGLDKDAIGFEQGKRTYRDQREDTAFSQGIQSQQLAIQKANAASLAQQRREQAQYKRDYLRYQQGKAGNDQIVFDNSGFPYKFKDANKNKNYAQIQSIMNMINKAGYQPSDALRTDMSLAMGDQQKTLAVEERMIAEYLRDTDDNSVRNKLLKAGVLEPVGEENPTNGAKTLGIGLGGNKGGKTLGLGIGK